MVCSGMGDDPSHGWEAAASDFMEIRSQTGVATVRNWARQLTSNGAVLDVGCGSGAPISAALLRDGFKVFGVDASPTLVAAF